MRSAEPLAPGQGTGRKRRDIVRLEHRQTWACSGSACPNRSAPPSRPTSARVRPIASSRARRGARRHRRARAAPAAWPSAPRPRVHGNGVSELDRPEPARRCSSPRRGAAAQPGLPLRSAATVLQRRRAALLRLPCRTRPPARSGRDRSVVTLRTRALVLINPTTPRVPPTRASCCRLWCASPPAIAWYCCATRSTTGCSTTTPFS